MQITSVEYKRRTRERLRVFLHQLSNETDFSVEELLEGINNPLSELVQLALHLIKPEDSHRKIARIVVTLCEGRGEDKLQMVKIVKEITQLGLKECKDLVDSMY